MNHEGGYQTNDPSPQHRSIQGAPHAQDTLNGTGPGVGGGRAGLPVGRLIRRRARQGEGAGPGYFGAGTLSVCVRA